MPFPPLKFEKDVLKLLDQRRLPEKEIWITCRSSREVHQAIKAMIVRGAPAIGISAGYGLYLGIKNFKGNKEKWLRELSKQAAYLKTARPTAVNLQNILDQIVTTVSSRKFADSISIKKAVLEEAKKAHCEDDRLCRTMGYYGSKLLKSGHQILTHCNAGGLATTGFGTALGVIYAAANAGKRLHVYADETRPLLQGARLTAWELSKSKIPCTLLCDNMAASLMRAGKIDCVIVGADRIAANGDTANKIGTYGVAVLARTHGIPFYVAAPKTTFDFKIASGRQIPIEERASEEVTEGFGKRTAPRKIRVWNPAFDVTPYSLITGFITEAGVLKPPYDTSFKKLKVSISI